MSIYCKFLLKAWKRAGEGKTLKDLSYDIVKNEVGKSQTTDESVASLLMQLDDSE